MVFCILQHWKNNFQRYVKKINQLVLKAFLGPFVMTFFICLFILLMQFLWKYVDDLVGKGLGWFVITKLMIFASATLVPLALPLALLLSSIMTFGNLAEQYELVACKSAGLSLQRVMRPLIVAAILLSGGRLLFCEQPPPYREFQNVFPAVRCAAAEACAVYQGRCFL